MESHESFIDGSAKKFKESVVEKLDFRKLEQQAANSHRSAGASINVPNLKHTKSFQPFLQDDDLLVSQSVQYIDFQQLTDALIDEILRVNAAFLMIQGTLEHQYKNLRNQMRQLENNHRRASTTSRDDSMDGNVSDKFQR